MRTVLVRTAVVVGALLAVLAVVVGALIIADGGTLKLPVERTETSTPPASTYHRWSSTGTGCAPQPGTPWCCAG